MRWKFVLGEVGIGLRRNLTMTIATVITVAVSLGLLGGALLTRAQVDQMKDYWYDKVEVAVFLCGDISSESSCPNGAVTDEQRKQIETDLRALPQVQDVFYESQQEAFLRFKEQFRNNQAIVENTTPDVLPESFRVKLKDPEQFAIIYSAFSGRPGVEEVQDQRAILEKFFRGLNGAQLGALVLAVLMIVVVVLLIMNTMQVLAFSRRRETGIMRLVGASNTYIQLPFVLEAILAALIGALLATLFLVGTKILVIDHWLAPNFQFLAYIGWPAVWGTIAVIVIFGVVLAAVTSWLTLQRYLRV
jgi:cell division transport system permease protein